MNRLLEGQCALILCCAFYLIWRYRGFRPGVTVNRIVTSELLLIVVWTMLEAAVINWLNAGGYLPA